eukprot:3439937-Pyramimonas_sp.AAC.1
MRMIHANFAGSNGVISGVFRPLVISFGPQMTWILVARECHTIRFYTREPAQEGSRVGFERIPLAHNGRQITRRLQLVQTDILCPLSHAHWFGRSANGVATARCLKKIGPEIGCQFPGLFWTYRKGPSGIKDSSRGRA